VEDPGNGETQGTGRGGECAEEALEEIGDWEWGKGARKGSGSGCRDDSTVDRKSEMFEHKKRCDPQKNEEHWKGSRSLRSKDLTEGQTWPGMLSGSLQ